jgi:putative transposase
MSRYRRSRATGGTYFFTVTLADRGSRLLVEHIDRLRRAYGTVQSRHPFHTVAICVLPDHIHAIWRLPDGDADFGRRWGSIKRLFSAGFDAATHRTASKIAKREKGIWQRRFWEHAIRDDADLARHVDYVHFNPVKHGHAVRVADWPYSSFRRHVREGTCPPDTGGGRPASGRIRCPMDSRRGRRSHRLVGFGFDLVDSRRGRRSHDFRNGVVACVKRFAGVQQQPA